MLRRASLQSKDYPGAPICMIVSEHRLPPSHLMPQELDAILSYIGRLPAPYVARLLPYELVLTIHQAMWKHGSTVYKPRGAATRINFQRLGDTAKLIIECVKAQQRARPYIQRS